MGVKLSGKNKIEEPSSLVRSPDASRSGGRSRKIIDLIVGLTSSDGCSSKCMQV